jgi:hypothetical protein
MPGSGPVRLVAAALRCYPGEWRRRRGDEAADLALLLMRDGVPARAIAGSYLLGAARARLALPPRRRLGTAVAALLIAASCLGAPLALVSSLTPANAVTVVRPRVTPACAAAGPTRRPLRSRPGQVPLRRQPAAPGLAGSSGCRGQHR